MRCDTRAARFWTIKLPLAPHNFSDGVRHGGGDAFATEPGGVVATEPGGVVAAGAVPAAAGGVGGPRPCCNNAQKF